MHYKLYIQINITNYMENKYTLIYTPINNDYLYEQSTRI